MQVIPSGEMDAEQGDERHFSGTVWQVVLRKIEPPSGINIYSVLFEPKARTAWHSHPGGQILHVTSGKGRIVCLEGSHAQAFEKEVTALLEEYRQLQAHIRATSPRYAALTQPQPLTLAEMQQLDS